jgi:nicotinate-nucleotide adenylyltransferase
LKLGVLGGTFDPPHVGHLALALAATDHLSLEKVLWIPAGQPWRKEGREITAAEHRLAMTELAIEGVEGFEVSDIEVLRPGPSYIVDTLAELLGRYGPDTELYLILGQDALLDMPAWKEPERIVALAWLVVALRSPAQDLDVTEVEKAVPGVSRRIIVVPMSFIDVSATAIRAWAKKGASLEGLVPPPVESYIKSHALYTE